MNDSQITDKISYSNKFIDNDNETKEMNEILYLEANVFKLNVYKTIFWIWIWLSFNFDCFWIVTIFCIDCDWWFSYMIHQNSSNILLDSWKTSMSIKSVEIQSLLRIQRTNVISLHSRTILLHIQHFHTWIHPVDLQKQMNNLNGTHKRLNGLNRQYIAEQWYCGTLVQFLVFSISLFERVCILPMIVIQIDE